MITIEGIANVVSMIGTACGLFSRVPKYTKFIKQNRLVIFRAKLWPLILQPTVVSYSIH